MHWVHTTLCLPPVRLRRRQVLRRFSLQYELGLPGPEQRSHILRGYLLKHAAEVIGSVDDALLCNQTVAGITAPGQGAIDWVASRTADFSGSDLQELCAQAAQRVLGEFELEAEQGASLLDAAMARSPGLFGGLRRALGAGESDAAAAAASSSHQQKPADVVQKLRPVALSDFVSVLKFVKPSTRNAAEYRSANNWEGGGGGSGLSITDLLQLATAMYNLQGGAAAGAARSGGAANGSQSTSAHNDAAPAPSAS